MTISVSIVIPYHNGWEMSHQLLYDLYRHDKDNIQEVMLIDDASDDGSIGGATWWKKLLPVRVYRFEENMGFLLSANKGLKKATGDIKILISNDVRVYQSFIQQVIQLFVENPKRVVGNYFHPDDTGWNKFGDILFPYMAGYMLASTSDGWKELGYFDERYVPNDYEDVDISTNALKLGYKLTSLNLSSIIHKGGQTIKYCNDRLKLTNENKRKFEEKWMK
jgi:GT2 family glycosyltransferase